MSAQLTRGNECFDEASVIAVYEAAHLTPQRWRNAPGDTYAAHSHGYHKILHCLQGSITFILSESERYELHAGDRLDIEPHTPHAALVGPEGVTCIEAART